MDTARKWLVLVVAIVVGTPSWTLAQSSWSSGSTTTPTSLYDRYGQPLVSGAQAAADRAGTAFAETGTSLREGVDAGVRAAEQSLNNLTATAGGAAPAAWPSTPSISSTGPSLATATAGATGAPASSMSAIRPLPNGGWTSIGSAIAAPPLLVPKTPTIVSTNFGNAGSSIAPSTQSISAASSNEPTLHSVLTDPSKTSQSSAQSISAPPTAAKDDWASRWGNTSSSNPVTLSRDAGSTTTGNVRDSGLVSLQPPANAPSAVTISGANQFGAPGDSWPNSWPQSSQSTAPAGGFQSSNRPGSAANGNSSFFNNSPPAGTFAGQSGSQPVSGTNAGNFTMGNLNQNTNPATGPMMNGSPNNGGSTLGSRNQNGATATSDQPWMPLVAAVLTLAGSLAANLYLGVSYLDARQKYQLLVRKTADTFRRVKAAAA